MNEFKIIITKFKEILSSKDQFDKKIRDKDVAQALNIKPTTLASYKRRDNPPYKAILTYCYNNRFDIRKILFNEDQSIINYPKQKPIEEGKVRVRYFRTLEAYEVYLNGLKPSSLL